MNTSPSLLADFERALDPTVVFRQGVRDLDGSPAIPDQWQIDLLRSESSRELILCNRQAGKSTTVGAKVANWAVYDPGLYLLIAPVQRQSIELFRKVVSTYRGLEGVPRITSESALKCELENGTRIIALPGDDEGNIRGYSAPKAILIDEASRVADSVYYALRPMLATSGGRLVALTTPYGRRGWFHDAWENGEGWKKTLVTADDCPRITADFLREERAVHGDWYMRQEYFCEFVDTDEQFFSSELVDAMQDSELEGLWPMTNTA